MKHGPIALLDESTPVVCVATDSPVLEKVLSNVEEVRARGADTIAIATAGSERVAEVADETIEVAAQRLDPAADPGDPAAAAARLLHRPPQRPQRRPAAQPGQDRHGRVIGRDAVRVRAPLRCPAYEYSKPCLSRPVQRRSGGLRDRRLRRRPAAAAGDDPASLAPAELAALRRGHGQARGRAEDEHRGASRRSSPGSAIPATLIVDQIDSALERVGQQDELRGRHRAVARREGRRLLPALRRRGLHRRRRRGRRPPTPPPPPTSSTSWPRSPTRR